MNLTDQFILDQLEAGLPVKGPGDLSLAYLKVVAEVKAIF